MTALTQQASLSTCERIDLKDMPSSAGCGIVIHMLRPCQCGTGLLLKKYRPKRSHPLVVLYVAETYGM